MSEDYKMRLVNRIAECQDIINDILKLKKNKAYKRIVKELEKQKVNIDENWQYVSDEKRLTELRVTKLAVTHMLNLEKQYQQEIEQIRGELTKLGKTEYAILKDYDTETKLEPGEQKTDSY